MIEGRERAVSTFFVWRVDFLKIAIYVQEFNLPRYLFSEEQFVSSKRKGKQSLSLKKKIFFVQYNKENHITNKTWFKWRFLNLFTFSSLQRFDPGWVTFLLLSPPRCQLSRACFLSQLITRTNFNRPQLGCFFRHKEPGPFCYQKVGQNQRRKIDVYQEKSGKR